MKIAIAGGTGFIGQAFIKQYQHDYDFTIISRDTNKAKALFPSLPSCTWETSALNEVLLNSHLVINLAGESIGEKRWSEKVKKAIIDSRVIPTKAIVDGCLAIDADKRPRLFNASAIGVYGLQKDLKAQITTIFNEDSPLPAENHDFLSTVGKAWEGPLDEASELNAVKLRFAVVLGPNGGMLAKVKWPFKLGFGGPIGSGKQPFSWIAIEDVLAIMKWLIEKPNLTGAINLVAPEVVSQKGFAKTFAKRLHRPCVMPMPSFIVKLLFGQMGDELLLNGQTIQSSRLNGYSFQYPKLVDALNHWEF